MIKILCYLKLYALKNKSGGELYLHYLLKQIKERYNEKVEIKVLLPENEEIKHFVYDGIDIYETNEINSLDYIKHCDVLITQLDFAPQSLEIGLKLNKKCILILHCHLSEYDKFIYNDKVLKIINSKNIYNLIKKENKNREINNYFIIYPFTDFYKYNKHCMEIKDREYITLVNPQRIKGGDVFLQLIKKFPNKKFLLVEGGYYPHLQELHRFKNLPNCHLVKNTDNMIDDVYNKSKIVLMPSRWDTWGMVASESRAMGIPCICNKNCEGLVENMGKVNLYGITPNEDANENNIDSYINLINLLDHKETYILWSTYLINESKIMYEKQMKQTYNFLDNFIDFVNF